MLHALSGGAARVVGVDLSSQMLARADTALGTRRRGVPTGLVRGSVCALPVADARADLTICGLVAGHVEDLRRCLAELWRVTRPGGSVLCSDVHPIGHALGWVRDFRFDGQRYAVRSEEPTSELQSLMSTCNAVFCLEKTTTTI